MRIVKIGFMAFGVGMASPVWADVADDSPTGEEGGSDDSDDGDDDKDDDKKCGGCAAVASPTGALSLALGAGLLWGLRRRD